MESNDHSKKCRIPIRIFSLLNKQIKQMNKFEFEAYAQLVFSFAMEPIALTLDEVPHLLQLCIVHEHHTAQAWFRSLLQMESNEQQHEPNTIEKGTIFK